MNTYTIENSYQKLTIIPLGAAIYKWEAFSDKRNIVITNKNLKDYADSNKGFLSSTIGRVANRIKDGKFVLNDKTYQLEKNFHGGNHGHGGSRGFFAREFELVEKSVDKLKFKYYSKDLEEGYPGNLILFVTYEINDNNLKITYEASSDKDTIVNITNHSYFNLSNEENILNHEIKVDSNFYLETDNDLIPTGKYLNVENTDFDLRKRKHFKDIIFKENIQKITKGLDHFFMFNKKKNLELKFGNKILKITSSYPGLQIYTCNNYLEQEFLDRKFNYHMGVAFEPQFEPDAINHKNFSNIILRKDEKYLQSITYTLIEK